MISIKKLRTLKRSTAIRKITRLLFEFETGRHTDAETRKYVLSLFEILLSDDDFKPGVKRILLRQQQTLVEMPFTSSAVYREHLERICNTTRHVLLQSTGAAPGDWDLYDRKDSPTSAVGQARIDGMRIFLEDLRSPYNVGSIFRTAESFSAGWIFLTDSCPSPDHSRARRAAMGCTEIVPWSRSQLGDISNIVEIFALELGGTDIGDFSFPEDGIAIVGNEELGISPEARALVHDHGRGIVTIPTFGVKSSLNVAAACAIMLHTWRRRITLTPPVPLR